MSWRIGVDSGGTFTDICLFSEETGELQIWKVPSTPDDPSRGIAEGVEQGLARVGATAADLGFLGHGTTVATNALIEHKGVRTGLVVTDGFRDLLEIGRQKRPSLYDMNADKPAELVPRDLRQEVPERLRPDGSVEVPFDEDAFREAVQTLRADGVQSLAICFLYGFLNTAHEDRAREIAVAEMPEAFISASHDVAPEFREFERLSTTVINAYLGPVMQRYIRRLSDRLDGLGLGIAPQLTLSNGGVVGFAAAAELPVRTVLSGPSTGVVAAQEIGRLAGYPDVITFDVGGTSSDVALLKRGVCGLTGESIVHGYPIKAPMLDIHTVGAGGGSIAHVDTGGLLKVGPQSAGADPGPVCYGLGNDQPTVTDANVVLGTLNPAEILGGRMKLSRDLAEAATLRLAERLGLGVMETAQGIISVLTANMAKAIRVISVQRGHDPRDYALMAFGGAGPLHAARLARELDMPRVIVPLTPGTLCALGLLLTDLRADFAISRLARLDAEVLPGLGAGFADLDAQAGAWFAAERIAPAARHIRRTVDMRYQGQNYELPVPLPDGPLNDATLSALREGFEAIHAQRFGFTAPEVPIQIVTLRAEAAGRVSKARIDRKPPGGADPSAAVTGARPVWMPEVGGYADCTTYERAQLRPGNVVEGPAIIDQMDTTTVVLPGMTATVDPYLSLILEDRA